MTFYSSANWLDFCATEHGAEVEVVSAGEVSVPVTGGADLTGSSYDWNAKLADRSLPTLGAEGLLVGPCEGYQTHVLGSGEVTGLLAELRARNQTCVAMYLDTEGVRRFRAAGVQAPPVLLDCDAWMPVPEGGYDAWLATLSGKRRTAVRKEVSAFTEAGFRIEHLPLRECSAAIAPLAVTTEAKYGFQAGADDDLATFRNHEKCLGDAARVALCTLDDTPVGFCLYYVWQDTIFLRWAGFDYSLLRDAYEYFNLLYYEQFRWASEQGIQWIHAGIKATKAKAARGAAIHPLWLLDLSENSPLIGAEQAVHDHNSAFLDALLEDSTLARSIADLEEWK
ncbi:GNAT family N-acetyltransferase [Herbidospora mongoliensis]|uniref:GNAT family N-acetyltransferase n=1 Tax=Herbidospora mongoliensis TaxID=688067 RepID=UPI00082AEBFF|nr:GNAT family N-acetyltransferase [Herbidospora mongoliensis]